MVKLSHVLQLVILLVTNLVKEKLLNAIDLEILIFSSAATNASEAT